MLSVIVYQNASDTAAQIILLLLRQFLESQGTAWLCSTLHLRWHQWRVGGSLWRLVASLAAPVCWQACFPLLACQLLEAVVPRQTPSAWWPVSFRMENLLLHLLSHTLLPRPKSAFCLVMLAALRISAGRFSELWRCQCRKPRYESWAEGERGLDPRRMTSLWWSWRARRLLESVQSWFRFVHDNLMRGDTDLLMVVSGAEDALSGAGQELHWDDNWSYI